MVTSTAPITRYSRHIVEQQMLAGIRRTIFQRVADILALEQAATL